MKTARNPFRRFDGAHLATTFDSVGAFADYVAEHGAADRLRYSGRFYSGERLADTVKRCRTGDQEAAEDCKRIMKEVTAPVATPRRERIEDVRGRVSVGAYLGGSPTCFRRSIEVRDTKAPVTVAVSLNSMADVKTHELRTRGIAVAALVRRMALERPVELLLTRFSHTLGSDPAECAMIKFPTAPLDSYRLAYLLTSGGFQRGLGFAFHMSTHKRNVWSNTRPGYTVVFAGGNSYSQHRNCPFSRDLSDYLGRQVLYIPGSDRDNSDFRRMVDAPVQWINETIEAIA